MPAPPAEIRVKRKATDDPVELLRVQNEYNGLHQVRQYVFKRQRTLLAQPAKLSSTKIPPSMNTSQLSNHSSADNQDIEKASNLFQTADLSPTVKTSSPPGTSDGTNSRTMLTFKNEPRRFHLSRNEVRAAAEYSPNHLKELKGSPTVFIEQRQGLESRRMVPDPSTLYESRIVLSDTPEPQHEDWHVEEQKYHIHKEPRLLATRQNASRPSGKVVVGDSDSATLAAQMRAYTLQEAENNLSSTSVREISETSTMAKGVSTLKPKDPRLKYHEQHLGDVEISSAKRELSQDEIMIDATNPEGEDPDYVMDTYLRMPAEMFELEKQKSVGVLVLDSQPDINDFYNDDSDSDSDIYDEEEDENAENHPSTDYPDEEDELEDGLEKNPYQNFRDYDATDSDGYNEDETEYGDEEAHPLRVQRQWLSNSKHHEHEGFADDDDD